MDELLYINEDSRLAVVGNNYTGSIYIDDSWFTEDFVDYVDVIELVFYQGYLCNIIEKRLRDYDTNICISGDYEIIFDNGTEVDFCYVS